MLQLTSYRQEVKRLKNKEILQRKEEIRSLLADETNKNLNFDELEKEVRDLTKKKKKSLQLLVNG